MAQNNVLFTQSGGKLLTFLLEKQEYGIEILEAREVVGIMPIDAVPHTPNFMKGVINLRGKIIPVIDLRTKFGMQPTEPTKEFCIVVVDISNRLTGIIVDFLVGVVTIEEKEFEETPELGSNIRTDFIKGMAKLEKRVIIVLDIKNILSNDELVLIQTKAK
ncbi:MAG: purine-binding chemotaxis protein CheW [Desulfobacterales bacterium]|nr:purine-binding chemotaxis protein CheW [Desulfobacterales bacterium]MBF0398787.1 purine-binding chemotaxis protein CheW [Desulfobacterales bacterium]